MPHDPFVRSLVAFADSPERRTFIHGHVISPIALDQILWSFFRRPNHVALKLDGKRDLFLNPSSYASSFRVPSYMISNSKFLFQEALFREDV